MPPALTYLLRYPAVSAFGTRTVVAAVLIGALHLAALVTMLLTEAGLFAQLAFILVWAVLNGVLLAAFRRPAISAALSLLLVMAIIGLSEFKISIVSMSINFFDVLIIDRDTIAFLLAIFPDLRVTVAIALLVAVPALGLIWWHDPFRVPRRTPALGAIGGFGAFIGLCVAVPVDPGDVWTGANHVSIFARSGISTASALMTHGWIDFDRVTTDRLLPATDDTCTPKRKPPHIIMVLDEGSFDITALPGVNVPDGYARYFRSFDGKSRRLFVEGVGGPTWYTEYNVLTGLSVQSYGSMSYYVTRIAAGHVKRGLPQSLRRCGYKTISLYPAYGAFLSARAFQTGTGVERFLDLDNLKQVGNETDYFFYDQALRELKHDKSNQPLFIFVYTVINHFPWDWRFRPDLTPDWRNLNANLEVDEYVRRQTMSADDFAKFMGHLRQDFPDESFLVVRFGDHQPFLAKPLLDAAADQPAAPGRLLPDDLRYYTTYYAMDTVNFRPQNVSSALDALDAPYLPLVVLEAAGLPLDASFAEQKRILQRCGGLFYRCASGAEARRFNRLLMDAGLITGMSSR